MRPRAAFSHQAAFLAAAGGKVFASRIFRSAEIDAGAPVLVAHLRLDVHHLLAAVERVHQRGVLLADVAAAHLARAGQLAVVGVELLVQDQEAMDLRVGESPAPAARSAFTFSMHSRTSVVDLVARGEVDVARVGQVALLRPVAHRLHVDVDEGADAVAPVAEGHRLLDVGKELELVLEVLRREQRAVGELADVLDAVDDLDVPVGVEVARIAGVEPALRVLRLGGRLRVLVVLLEQARRADQQFALRRELELDALRRPGPTVSDFTWPLGWTQTNTLVSVEP